MTIDFYRSEEAPPPAGPYSHGVVANGLLFTCGMGPANPVTGVIEAQGIEAQTRQTLTNLLSIVKARGLDFSSVIKVTAHLQHADRDFAAYNQVYREFFSEPYPARTTVGSNLIGMLVEIDLVVAL